MTTLRWIMAGGFLLNIAIGLGFVTSRKGSAESLLAALLFGTAGVALAWAKLIARREFGEGSN